MSLLFSLSTPNAKSQYGLCNVLSRLSSPLYRNLVVGKSLNCALKQSVHQIAQKYQFWKNVALNECKHKHSHPVFFKMVYMYVLISFAEKDDFVCGSATKMKND